jgi:aldose 1-epimerase
VENGTVTLKGGLVENEGVYGGGERFDTVNKRGTKFDLYTSDGWNKSSTTYMAIPLFLTTRGAGIYVNRYERMTVDFGKSNLHEWSIWLENDTMDCYIYATGDIKDPIESYTKLTGTSDLPEEWSYGVMLCRYSSDLTTFENDRLDEQGNPVLNKDNAPSGRSVKTLVQNMINAGMKPTAVVMEGWNYRTVTTSSSARAELRNTVKWLDDLGIKAMVYMAVGGSFTFDGREYTLPLNEPATGCHVHGALYAKAFTVTEQSESAVTLAFHAEAGEYNGFPHPFSFTRTYRADENGLYEEDTVTNLSDLKMPFLLAYHTTFNLAFLKGATPENTHVRLSLGKEEMRTEKFIPTGVFRAPAEREEAFSKGTYAPHGKHLSAFYEVKGDGTAKITDTKANVAIHYEAAEDFAYRMLFATKDGGFFVCEPQTAAIDCFHLAGTPEEHGLIALAPKESKTLWTRISVK